MGGGGPAQVLAALPEEGGFARSAVIIFETGELS